MCVKFIDLCNKFSALKQSIEIKVICILKNIVTSLLESSQHTRGGFFYIFPVPFSSHHYPSGGPYCITVPFVLAYIQSLLELCCRLSLVADIAISFSIVCYSVA